jgi:hypothetical protein
MTAWTGWIGDGDDALSYVEEQLAERWTDVASKLIGASCDETHAVVLLVDDIVGPMWAIEEGKTPTRQPQLPQGIDGLWIVARGRSRYAPSISCPDRSGGTSRSHQTTTGQSATLTPIRRPRDQARSFA